MSAGTSCACGRFTVPASGMVPISDGVWHFPVRSDLCEIVMLREALRACKGRIHSDTCTDVWCAPECKAACAALIKAEGRS